MAESKALPGSLQAAPQAVADDQAGSMNLLTGASPFRSDERTKIETSGWDLERLFDGKARGRSTNETGVPAAVRIAGPRLMSPAPELGRPAEASSPEAGTKTPSPAGPANRSKPKHAKPTGLSNAAIALLAAAAVIAMPILATTLGVSLSTLSLTQPIATVFTTLAGAICGLVTSMRKEGGASAGEIVSAVVCYGILGGAGMYLLLDLSQLVLLGKAASSISPLPTALATATLGQTAFQGKFADAETSSADRIMSVFPAVAAALGLAITTKLPAVMMMTMAVHAMAVTGLAVALYAALFRPGVSQAKGPASMARGMVLQALMSGLALAVANPLLSAGFLALGAWGFLEVLLTTGRELYARLPAFLQVF